MLHETSFEIHCSFSLQLKRLKMENLDCVNSVIVFRFARATKNRISPFMDDLNAKNSKLKNSLLIVLWENVTENATERKTLLVHFPWYLIRHPATCIFIFIIIKMFVIWNNRHFSQRCLRMTKIHVILTTKVLLSKFKVFLKTFKIKYCSNYAKIFQREVCNVVNTNIFCEVPFYW